MELYEHQKRAIDWLRGRDRGILALDMGLGKTVCALRGFTPRHLPATVICPASVRRVWEDEIRKWDLGYRVSVLESGSDRPAPGTDITVVSYALAVRGGLPRPASLVFDESHYLQSRTAQRTKWAFGAVKAVGKCWFLSGTPMFSTPKSLWTQLMMIGALPGAYWSYRRYADTFCGGYFNKRLFRYIDTGATNLGRLREIVKPVMLRMTKDDFLDLPPKVRQVVKVDADRGDFEKGLRLEDIQSHGIPAGQVATLIREAGLAKVPFAAAHIKAIAALEPKVVVFAWNKDVIRRIYGLIGAELDAVTVTGESSPEDRHQAVKRFQEDPGCRLFLGQTVASGVGITLTAARVVVMVQPEWTPANLMQAEDRVHRIGQTLPVLIQYLVLHGSIEEHQVETAVYKMDCHDQVINKERARK